MTELSGVLIFIGLAIALRGYIKSRKSDAVDYNRHYYLGGALVAVGVVLFRVLDVLY
jgi:hypothetical protein